MNCHIHNRGSLSPDLIQSVERVLGAAAGDLQSNIFLFLDVDTEISCAPEGYGTVYAATMRPGSVRLSDPCFAAFRDAVTGAVAGGPFPVMIWISSLSLSSAAPKVFRTGVLAHELGHARQIEHAEQVGDVLDAWDCYEDFLVEKQQLLLSHWRLPHEIDAELFARQLIRQLHPGESLHPLLKFYKDYGPVLEFEFSGGFELFGYFAEVIRQGPSGLRDWISTTTGLCRGNAILLQLAP